MVKARTLGLLTFALKRGRKETVGGNISRLSKVGCIVFLCCAAAVIASPAQTFTTLYSFCSQPGCADGAEPLAGLMQGTDGNFYGTTSFGASNGGTVFKITPSGKLITLHTFCSQPSCADGYAPFGGLVQGKNGNFYGTTKFGGINNLGTIFKITAAGKLTTLYSFCPRTGCADGSLPLGRLIQAADGKFYGTTSEGGAKGAGTVFKITSAGLLTTLYNFCAKVNCNDGNQPWAGLMQAGDGSFYGTTKFGGFNNAGTAFKITSTGTLTTLHIFCTQGPCPDGEFPYAELMQATNGNFYGTTYEGGANGANGPGTIFEITSGGTFSTLYSFGGIDGAAPVAGLTQATDGNFYGTTSNGGVFGGTVFEINPEGTLTTLHNFDGTDGAYPEGMLMQATDGSFYGTTDGGGANSYGTVFNVSTGLPPFVEARPSSGKVGATVIIIGNNLIAASAVSFAGTPATFTVVKSTEIKTRVPAGATTGTVEVTTPSGTLASNVAFRVIPQVTSFTPTGGPAGTRVQITGVSLTQTTGVIFGSVVATEFNVNSDTQVEATVPIGATTGKIEITTPGGTATSAGSFKVTK